MTPGTEGKMRMRIGVMVFAAALISLAATSPDTREITDPKKIASAEMPGSGPVPIDDLFYTRATGGGAWSPDGKEIVFTSNFTGRFNLWKVSATGGWPIQLSQSDDRQGGAIWSPDGKWILYQSDRGGARESDEDGRYFGDVGGLVAGRIATRDFAQEEDRARDRRCSDGLEDACGAKPDERRDAESSLDGAHLEPRRKIPVCDADQRGLHGRERVPDRSGDGTERRLDAARRADANDRIGRLAGWEDAPGDGSPSRRLSERGAARCGDEEADVGDGSEMGSGGGRIFTGRKVVHVRRERRWTHRRVSGPGLNGFSGNPSTFSPDGQQVLISHQSSAQPGDLWVYGVGAKRATQLTFSAIASLTAAKLPSSELVHYKTFDGKTISAFLWVPYNLKRDGSNPGIVLPHGGPTGQTVDSFNRWAAALASRGYVCVAPNVRGSTGYGIDFQKANVKDLGGGDLEDEVYAAKFLAATGYVDEKKIGMTGGSYGGYMTLMAIGKKPDLWAAAVEQYGIINWLTMLKHEDPFLQEYEKSLMGDPVKDLEVYENASPIKYIRNAKAPLLVLQGENDIRVPKEEAEQVVAIYKETGKTVDAHYYAQEGHGFAKRENQIDAISRTLAWFDRYLKSAK
ncbi:MAG: S9 family peptidase [Acidobacteria bacterium]|nr:MAG: S9 family peptidase [Acidobacteriota bacterium]